jgi:putative ABC transport system permease protein
VIGKRIEVNDQTLEIVGVMPRQFAYPVGVEFPTEVYWPIAFTSDDKVRGSNRNYNWLAIARLKPGVSIEQAHDQMNRVAVALDEQYPKFNPGMRVRVVTLHYHPGRKSPSSASSETSVISARKRRRGRSATCRWRRTASQE